MTKVTIAPAAFRRVLGAFPSGVTAVAALVEGRPVGLTASSFTSVSLAPPLVSVCVSRTSATWAQLRSVGSLGISVLSAEQRRIARALAGPGDRFAGAEWRATGAGAVLLDGSTAWFECLPHQVVPAGDHDIVVLRVVDLGTGSVPYPLVFHRSDFTRLEPAPSSSPGDTALTA